MSDARPPFWPAVDWEERPWTSRYSRDVLSRRQWESSQGPYRVSVPPLIADVPVVLSAETVAEADEASSLLTRFDAQLGPAVLPFASILLRSESASSSQIENLTSGARAVAETELGERDTGNASLIVRNVRALTAALALADELDETSVVAMHEALLGEHERELTGGWRSEQVWIGGGGVSPHGADFVPPHQDRVPAGMSDLMAFVARRDVPALAHAAVAHAQFETIHPFPDGNGRTGRALVQAMLRASRVTTNVSVPVSAGLLYDVDAYYDALDRYRAGDVDAVVRAFSAAAGHAVRNGRELVDDLDALRAGWDDALAGLRSHHAARRLADLAVQQPVLNGTAVTSRLGVSAPTAYRALDELVARGVLRPANSQRRNRIWIADAVVTALDAFADRAARRAPRGP